MAKARSHRLRDRDIVDILYMFYVDRQSVKSIAEAFGIGVHTVSYHVLKYRKDFYRIVDYCSEKYEENSEDYNKCIWLELKQCVRAKMWKKSKKKHKKKVVEKVEMKS